MAFICYSTLHIYEELFAPEGLIQVIVEPAEVVGTPDTAAFTEMASHISRFHRLLRKSRQRMH